MFHTSDPRSLTSPRKGSPRLDLLFAYGAQLAWPSLSGPGLSQVWPSPQKWLWFGFRNVWPSLTYSLLGGLAATPHPASAKTAQTNAL